MPGWLAAGTCGDFTFVSASRHVSDDHVIAFFHGSEREGHALDAVTTMPMKVNAEGKLTEIWFLANDQRAFDQFWS